MSKQVLDIEQMKHLQELGLDTSKASMCYVVDDSKSYKPILCVSGNESEYLDAISYSVPAFTLQDTLSLLPKKITASEHQCSVQGDFFLYIDYEYPEISYSVLDDWCPGLNELKTVYINKDTELIDAAYEMLCWCLENGYVEKDFEDYETKV